MIFQNHILSRNVWIKHDALNWAIAFTILALMALVCARHSVRDCCIQVFGRHSAQHLVPWDVDADDMGMSIAQQGLCFGSWRLDASKTKCRERRDVSELGPGFHEHHRR
jgi:hypothetical protein